VAVVQSRKNSGGGQAPSRFGTPGRDQKSPLARGKKSGGADTGFRFFRGVDSTKDSYQIDAK